MPSDHTALQRQLVLFALCFVSGLITVAADSPYRFFDWTITYGDIYPLGIRQQVLRFPYTQTFNMCLY